MTVVGDRESDIYTLFERQAQCSEQVGLVVRVSAGRQRRVSAEEWIDGVRTELRIAWVELQPPKTRPGAAALGMLAVQVREMEETAGEDLTLERRDRNFLADLEDVDDE